MQKKASTMNFESLKGLIFKEKTLILDLGSHSVKGLDVLKKGRNVLINAAFEIGNTAKFYNGKDITNFEGMSNEIFRVVKLTDLKVKKTDIVYNSNTLQTKIVRVPDMTDKEIKEYVDIEYHKSFSNVSPYTHILDYLQLGLVKEEERNEQLILLASVPTTEPTKILKAFEKKSIEVNSIETNVHALGNALNLMDERSEYKQILHIGKEYSIILFSKGDVPIFYRTFSFGYNQLVRRMQEELSGSLGNVENLVKNLGFTIKDDYKSDIDLDTYELVLKENFNVFLNEVFRSISYVKMQSKFDPTEIYLSGGMANMNGIGDIIEEYLSVTPKFWEFRGGESNNHTFILKGQESLGPEYALALGMSMRGWM